MTSRLIFKVLLFLASNTSFKSVALEVDLSQSTVMRIFDHLSYQSSVLPRVIAIDEFKGNAGNEKYQCSITDPEKHKIIGILMLYASPKLASVHALKEEQSKTRLEAIAALTTWSY